MFDAIVVFASLMLIPELLCMYTTKYADDYLSSQKNYNPSSPQYVYTRPSSSIFGLQCVGDCIAGLCLVNKDGDLEPCRVLEELPTYIYYTSRFKYPEYTKCVSACVGVPSWCFVDHQANWDYCNSNLKSSVDQYEEAIATTENETPRKCISPCIYKRLSGKYLCKTSRETWNMCAPFAELAPLSLTANVNTSANALAVCLAQPNLRKYMCKSRQKREDDSDSEYNDAACLAADNPDYVDTYRRPDRRGIFGAAPFGTVLTEARAYRERGEMRVIPGPPPTSYTTIRNSELGLDLPITVRSRINFEALNGVTLPRPPNVISNTVPSLVRALQRIRYTHNGIAYDVGHMIAYLSGGDDADYNFAPQTATLNRGLWLSMENHIRDWVNNTELRPHAFVDMLIVIYYDPVVRYLPLAFGVNLAFYFAENRLASVCNDMIYFNQGNRNRRPRNVDLNIE